MKTLLFSIGILTVSLPSASGAAASSCVGTEEIRKTDRRYEESLITGDAEFLDNLLAEEFIWVHNHAGTVDTKESLLQKQRTRRFGPASESRDSADVEVRQKGSVAVVTGFTTVVRPDEFVKQTGALKSAKYHFMRTYVVINDECLLLANHTMQIPDSE